MESETVTVSREEFEDLKESVELLWKLEAYRREVRKEIREEWEKNRPKETEKCSVSLEGQ